MANETSKEAQLFAASAEYRLRSDENCKRVRKLAEALRAGFCSYLRSSAPPCVLLVPPQGGFEAKDYGAGAFSLPPQGFRPLAPVSFGLAVRISKEGEWMRRAITCRKDGEQFNVAVENGPRYTFSMPLEEQDPTEFFDLLFQNLVDYFTEAVMHYEQGEYGDREIGFDFFAPEGAGDPSAV